MAAADDFVPELCDEPRDPATDVFAYGVAGYAAWADVHACERECERPDHG